jgi:DNA-binding SARP family transcriptional activator
LQVDQIIEALFPNKAPEPAREGLYQACSALRRALEPQLPEKFPSRYLEVENGQVGLKIPPGSSLDFSDLAGYARDQHWEAILGVAGGGEFLPEMLYAEWTAAPRQRGKDLVQQALYEQAKGSLAAGQFQEALQYCQRLLEEEPWHEQAVLAGMEACLGLGDRAKARKLYRRLEKSLLEDLGCPPSEETQAFFRTLDRRVKPAGS